MKKIRLGRYRHYKGGEYQIIGEGKLEENLQDVVVYKPLYKNKFGEILWVRPKDNFFAEVESDGKKMPRFVYLGEK